LANIYIVVSLSLAKHASEHSVRLAVAGDWWLVLICYKSKVLLDGWRLVLVWCEKKILLAGCSRTE